MGEMTAAQKLAWEHRRINACVATVCDLKHWWTEAEVNQLLTMLNKGLDEIEGKQKKIKTDPKPMVAKKWSET